MDGKDAILTVAGVGAIAALVWLAHRKPAPTADEEQFEDIRIAIRTTEPTLIGRTGENVPVEAAAGGMVPAPLTSRLGVELVGCG